MPASQFIFCSVIKRGFCWTVGHGRVPAVDRGQSRRNSLSVVEEFSFPRRHIGSNNVCDVRAGFGCLSVRRCSVTLSKQQRSQVKSSPTYGTNRRRGIIYGVYMDTTRVQVILGARLAWVFVPRVDTTMASVGSSGYKSPTGDERWQWHSQVLHTEPTGDERWQWICIQSRRKATVRGTRGRETTNSFYRLFKSTF